jgi:uncharacterized protein YjbJ (UPF0337 family)
LPRNIWLNITVPQSTYTWLTSQFNSIVGSAKEVVGSGIETVYAAVGGSSEPSSFTTAGKEQHAKGEAEVKAAEAKGYAEG